jgi:hypothetical protein
MERFTSFTHLKSDNYVILFYNYITPATIYINKFNF